jgi:hypothetical protein
MKRTRNYYYCNYYYCYYTTIVPNVAPETWESCDGIGCHVMYFHRMSLEPSLLSRPWSSSRCASICGRKSGCGPKGRVNPCIVTSCLFMCFPGTWTSVIGATSRNSSRCVPLEEESLNVGPRDVGIMYCQVISSHVFPRHVDLRY